MGRIAQVMACLLLVAVATDVHAQSSDSLAVQEETAWKAAADGVAESVVQIRTIGGVNPTAGMLLAEGPTTGLVVSADGYILSSAFNFLQQPSSIIVTLASGKQLPAELVATDHSRMLVLLKVTGTGELKVPEAAPVDDIQPGQWAIALGRTFHPERANVSVGIVSAVDRMFGKVIQTDAAISTANYGGPLVDIRGRVLGIIVPMAPQGANEVAGAEWYDSGIGFAVPLSTLARPLERMKKGEDLRQGILGIGMSRKNPHASFAKLVTVRRDSPAGKAGLKKGDRIVEVDGKKIRTQTDLRFALGPYYGGDTVSIVAQRGDMRISKLIQLAGELPPFRHAYLGILPMRVPESGKEDGELAKSDEDNPADKSPPQGILVRHVLDGSPAAEADIRAGDRILRVNETEIDSISDAIQAVNNAVPGETVRVARLRANQTDELVLNATRIPTTIPSDLPSAYSSQKEAGEESKKQERKAGETVELKLAEFPNKCTVYVPSSTPQARPLGLLLWLHAPGKIDHDEVLHRWRSLCNRDGLLLVLPAAAENDRWERTELEYLYRLAERVVAEYPIDRQRIVVFGHEGGGSMAWLLGLADRNLFHGIATSAAPLPRQTQVPPNEPDQRLAIFAVMPPTKNGAAVQVAEGLQKFSDAGYPVSTASSQTKAGELADSQREELSRWIDSLDRF
jgi:serine protease Do